MVKVNKVRDILGKWLRISLRKKYHGHFVDMARIIVSERVGVLSGQRLG